MDFGADDAEQSCAELPYDQQEDTDTPWNKEFDPLGSLVEVVL